jgi:seryl-tRNA synthetase
MPAARQVDIETWIPSQQACHDAFYKYVYRLSGTSSPHAQSAQKAAQLHTLNGTAFAIGRILVAIMEQNQQADGSIVVPPALRPWVGKDVMGKRS